MDRLQKLIDHLREQEGGYTGLLESVLVSFHVQETRVWNHHLSCISYSYD